MIKMINKIKIIILKNNLINLYIFMKKYFQNHCKYIVYVHVLHIKSVEDFRYFYKEIRSSLLRNL